LDQQEHPGASQDKNDLASPHRQAPKLPILTNRITRTQLLKNLTVSRAFVKVALFYLRITILYEQMKIGYKVWLDNDGKAFGDGPMTPE